MNLELKSDIINSQQFDVNADFLVSCLLSEGYKLEDLILSFNSHFKRTWSRDIDSCTIERLEDGTKVLNFNLNRSGIYDTLPEALFHETHKDNNLSGEEMAKDSMRLKLEEKEARLFFKPFENEIFYQKVRLAQKETDIYTNIYSDLFNGLVPDFWQIDKYIPRLYRSRLIKLLPYVQTIVGNYELSAQALGYILEEKVKIRLMIQENENKSLYNNETNVGILGEGTLGKDTIMGTIVSGDIGTLKIYIGPLENTLYHDFFNDNPLARLVKCFTDYFLPLELDVETEILAEQTTGKLELNEEPGKAAFLGYNSYI